VIPENLLSFGPAHGRPGDSFVARAGTPSMIRRHIDRRGLLRFSALALACAVLAAAALVQIRVRTQVTHEAYALTRAASETRQLENQQRSLKAEVARLESPNRIEQLARERLGMGPAKAEQILILSGGVRPAAAAPGKAAVARR
jgi:cell division protein FtsL